MTIFGKNPDQVKNFINVTNTHWNGAIVVDKNTHPCLVNLSITVNIIIEVFKSLGIIRIVIKYFILTEFQGICISKTPRLVKYITYWTLDRKYCCKSIHTGRR